MHKGWKITFADKSEEIFSDSQLPLSTRKSAQESGNKVQRVFILR